MNKSLIFILLTIILVISIIILTQKAQAEETKNIQKTNYHSYTKAICNISNFCQDNLIECQDKEIKSISPITGAFVQFDKNWQDPRTQEEIEKEC